MHLFHAWLALLRRLRTRDRLRRWGLNVPAECVLCSSGIETHHHLYILWIWVLLQHLDAFCAGYHSCYSFGYSLLGRLDLWPSSSASSSTIDQAHPSVSHLPYLERAQCSCVQLSLHFSRRSSSRPRLLNPWSPNRLPISRPLTLLAAILFLVY